jgi:uncharacterized membrane protein YcgQ (UPF0703/DUF1980 family)
MFKDIANLLYVTSTKDVDGFLIETEEKTEVYVNKKSVTRSEFYTAMQAGMKPSIVFELRVEDFEMTLHMENNKPVYAQKIEYDGFVYEIIRTYSKNDSMIELTCG